MEVIVLGSGAFAPARRGEVRNPAGYAVRLGKRVLLFDFGFGNLRQLARAGVDPADVTDVFLSHRHPDHCGDLAALLFFFRYDAKPRAGRLRVWGPKGFAAFVGGLSRAWKPWLYPQGYKLSVRELSDGGRVRGEGWEVAACKVPHPTPAVAYRVLYKGRSLVYSGDTGFSARLADFAAGVDLLILECTMSDRQPLAGHLTAKEARAIIEASGCRRALLSHISEQSEPGASRLTRQNRRVKVARDRMRVRV